MRAVSISTAGLLAGIVLSAIACGNGDDSLVPTPVVKFDGGADASIRADATADEDAGGSEPDAAPQDAPGADAEASPSATPVLLRLANWSADSPGIDFCLAPHGSGAFQGPLLAPRAAAINEAGVVDAGSGAIAFPDVSAYLVVDPVQYDARIVASGSVDCSVGVVPDATSLPVLVSGGLETIALMGAAQPQNNEPALRLVGFVDEFRGTIATSLVVRVINAAVDLPAVQVGTLNTYLTPFVNTPVPFGGSSAVDPMADGNGYVPQLPLTNQTVAARTAVPSLLDAATHTIVAQATNVSLIAGVSATFVVVGTNGLRDGGGAAQLLECVDNSGTVGLQGSCHVVSP